MILAGDVGGTKTLLGLFDVADRRPMQVAARAYATSDFPSFSAILDAFARDIDRPVRIDAVAAGVAGPVVANVARLTNIAWDISAAEITARLGTTRVQLLNDLEAMANSVEALAPDEFVLLHEGIQRADAP
jgi:glucokinase